MLRSSLARRGLPRRPLLALSLPLFLLLGLSACKQNDGERCQINDDCMPGSRCEFGGNTNAMGGYCKSGTVTTSADMTAAPDMTVLPDMTVPPDLTM